MYAHTQTQIYSVHGTQINLCKWKDPMVSVAMESIETYVADIGFRSLNQFRNSEKTLHFSSNFEGYLDIFDANNECVGVNVSIRTFLIVFLFVCLFITSGYHRPLRLLSSFPVPFVHWSCMIYGGWYRRSVSLIGTIS